MYDKIKDILGMLWENDDYMDQEQLFELQDYVADLILEVAEKEGKIEDLLQSFPYIFAMEE